MQKKLLLKEKLFCYYYLKLQNYKEAAIKADYKHILAESIGAKLLQKKEILDYIKLLKGQDFIKGGLDNVKSGLERLAFGSICDSIKLILSGEGIDFNKIDTMDFFQISEIKKPKDGCFEIKFFDRLKALESLSKLYQNNIEDNQSNSFFSALEKSALYIEEDLKINNEV